MVTSSMVWPGNFFCRADLTHFACHNANLLPRVPIFSEAFINDCIQHSSMTHSRCRMKLRLNVSSSRRCRLWKQSRRPTSFCLLFCCCNLDNQASHFQKQDFQIHCYIFCSDTHKSAWNYLLTGHSVSLSLFMFDDLVKRQMHHVFGVLYFVFGMKYRILLRHVRTRNTKHQIPNTLTISLLFWPFTKSSSSKQIK